MFGIGAPEAIPLLIIGCIFVLFFWNIITKSKIKSKGFSLICSSCGIQGETKFETKGSFFIEVVLWLFFIIPGVIYTGWRLSNRQNICARCGSDQLIPIDSPKGQQMINSLSTGDK